MIEIKNLEKTYDKGRRHQNKVLHGISLSLPDTGFVCIVGASGCGKTSLLNAIGGLDSFDSGILTAGETTVKRSGTRKMEEERNRSFGYIFQNYYLLPEHSVGYNIYLGLHSSSLTHKEKLKRVKEVLREVDMSRYVNRAVGELSGGQQQRVAIARALARRPRVIFADEPTGNLDEANTVNICTLLRKISRHSLVLMVTHEDRIASFFADRVITLEDGRIKGDRDISDRADYSGENSNTIYTGDLDIDSTVECENVSLRILREEGTEPVSLTLVIQNDRIVIKLDSDKTVSCLRSEEIPTLAEGRRPVLSLKEMDAGGDDERYRSEQESRSKKQKCSLGFSTLLSEAKNLIKLSKKKNIGRSFFLIALTALAVFSVGDYITVANIDPEDFIISDSHILNVAVERGEDMPAATIHELSLATDAYRNHLRNKFNDIILIPSIPREIYYSTTIFPQYSNVLLPFTANSVVPLDFLDEGSIISGRAPENIDEIVVDRWVLDSVLSKPGILQNSISDRDYFLGKTLSFGKSVYAPTIVGICDSGEPSIYIPKNAYVMVGPSENPFIGISDLKDKFPGRYDEYTLEGEECLAVIGNANGSIQTGAYIFSSNALPFRIKGTISNDGLAVKYIISDERMAELYEYTINRSSYISIYTENKQVLKDFLNGVQDDRFEGKIYLNIIDAYGEQMAAYTEATEIKADARSIIIFTVMILSAAMLYLLSRSHVVSGMGMVAVYRLLGIPKRKLHGIFALECVLLSLRSSLPSAAITFTVLRILTSLPEIGFDMTLPISAAVCVYFAIVIFHLIVTAIPLARLLALPPARLATKYDF